MNILGISAFYHDSAACLVRDTEIIAAAQEERFTRIKHDANFPVNAAAYCLAEGKVAPDGIDAVVFYDKPVTKFVRLIKTYAAVAPHGFASFRQAVPVWSKQKLWTNTQVLEGLAKAGFSAPKELLFAEHHLSHAGSAYYPSPFKSAAILTVDGVGEWATTSLIHGRGEKMTVLKEIHFPHSLGLLYSAFTYYCGFKINSGEYKLMGLAPYGEPVYAAKIKDHLIDIKDDGSFQLNMEYFDYLGGLTMTSAAFHSLFGGPPREPESRLSRHDMDLAASIQAVTEEIVIKLARAVRDMTGEKNLCLAGGVALNCVANGKLIRERIFDDIWIQPASGDAGGALGAALYAAHMHYRLPRRADGVNDSMKGSYLGPSFSNEEIRRYLDANKYPYTFIADEGEWASTIARFVAEGKIIGLLNGRMEYGPRALGGRSIIGDARNENTQSVMNLKIKYRESFRPFAPSCMEEEVPRLFDLGCPSPYMLVVAPVRESLRSQTAAPKNETDLIERVNQKRSELPAITHVDYSARIQSVKREVNPRYYRIMEEFKKLTGYGVVVNTSYNVRGEPIVCTPEDAYRCFMRSEIDYLVLENCVLDKKGQPAFEDKADWKKDYVLD